MADQNGTRNPWDSDDSREAWNPSGVPQTREDAGLSGAGQSGAAASGSVEGSGASLGADDQPTLAGQDAQSDQSAQSGQGVQNGGDSQATQSLAPLDSAPTQPQSAQPQSAQPVQPAQPTQPTQPTQPLAAPTTRPSSQYSSAPEYGANTSNPTQPLSASAYPFGAPEHLDEGKNAQGHGARAAQKQQNAGQGQRPQYGAPRQSGQQPGFFGVGNNGAAGNGGSNGPTGPQNPFAFGPNDPNSPNQNPQNPQNQGAAQVRKSGSARTWIAAVASALIAALLVLGLGYAAIVNGFVTVPSASSTSSLNSSSGGSGSATVEGTGAADWAAVNKKVAASVVSITAAVSGGTAKGSGAIIDTDGDIVTNNHVVEGATQLQVTLSDGSVYSAKTVGTDSTTDLAVIKLEDAPSDLQAVSFADSSAVAVGESVMAIGNPLGYESTATTGIVSALNRPVAVTDESSNSEIVTNAIQIDAAIIPGNSGGPTFNAAGEVVGINSSIATASTTSSDSSESGSIGIGFAIPSNLVQRVAKEIISDGSVKHAQLGVTISTGSATADGETRAGAEVVTVTSGGAADKAGLQKGDVIVGFNGNVVSSTYSVLGFVRAAAVGDTVKLTVVRNSKTVDINVTLTEAESTSSSNGNSNNDNDDNGSGSDGDNGSGNDDGNGYGGLSDPFGLFGGQ